MSINIVNDKETIKSLFAKWNEACIWSCLQDCQGMAYTDDKDNPKSAQIILGNFCYFGGSASEELVRHIPVEYSANLIVMTPQNEQWAKLIETVWQEKATGRMCYATKKNQNNFDESRLQGIVAGLSAEFEIRLIEQELYDQTCELSWAKDWCQNYGSYEEYRKHGLGFAILDNNKVVAGASSYAYYHGGIEIEIDTHENYKQKGLASICGAKLILECLQRNLYPSWDAQNKISLKTAQKLGYEFDREYIAYDVLARR
jgi:Sortase and related acyltransferases